MKKRIISLVLCIAMFLGIAPQLTFAASGSLKFETELAEDLKELGLFKGVSDTDFALDRAPTRIEALVMLIRILGKEQAALSKGGKHPFLDVPEWADKYVGYAYENKLTNGMSATKFGSNTAASSSMYLTFVLRSLGYTDANGADFTWDNPYTLARQTGIMLGNPDTLNFLRGDVVLVSYAALEAEVKGTKQTLAQKLITEGAFSAAAYDKYYDIAAFENSAADAVRELTSTEVYEKCSPAVFYIEVYDKNGQPFAFGSGFFIASDGTAITNYHVIEGAYSAAIKRSDNNKIYKVLGIYDYNASKDWAVIKVEGNGFPYLEKDETTLKGGETIFTIGNPKGLDNTISEGLVSNPKRTLDGVPFIQISAPISSGSSGGALINNLGKVIGITTAVFKEGQNLNLAVPIGLTNGYKKKTIHPFTALLSNADSGMPFGNINLDTLPEDEYAFELLKMWIYNNQNKTMSYGPGCISVYELEGGGQQQFIISYDEANKKIKLDMYEFGVGRSYELGINMGFSTYETVDVYFSYYEEAEYHPYIYQEDIDDWGYAKAYKEQFFKNFNIWFSDYDGDYLNESDWQDMTAEVCLYMLSVVEYILTEDLSGYDVDGVRALGFDNCYFE